MLVDGQLKKGRREGLQTSQVIPVGSTSYSVRTGTDELCSVSKALLGSMALSVRSHLNLRIATTRKGRASQRTNHRSIINPIKDMYCMHRSETSSPAVSKGSRKPFRHPGERVMSDVWGPARVVSIGGWKYYVSFTDNSIRYVLVLFLRDKGEAPQWINEHTLKIKQRFGKAPMYM